MNLNVTHKAEIYGDVSGSKWEINALAAQRLRVLNEAISGKTTVHRQNIWNFLFTYMFVYTNIHTNGMSTDKVYGKFLRFEP